MSLILDLSPEATTRGVLYKNLFLEIWHYSWEIFVLECLQKPRLFLIIDVLQLAKLLELLAINHSWSERRIIFIPRLLKFFHALVIL